MTRLLWLRRGSALVVTVVAAYASYEHQRRFASVWGSEQVSAVLWPLSVDGLVVLASLGLLEVGPGARLRVRWSVRTAFLLGVAVSLLANIAAAPVLTWQSVVVAGWPPVALLLASSCSRWEMVVPLLMTVPPTRRNQMDSTITTTTVALFRCRLCARRCGA
jgi:hypothetical protein